MRIDGLLTYRENVFATPLEKNSGVLLHFLVISWASINNGSLIIVGIVFVSYFTVSRPLHSEKI